MVDKDIDVPYNLKIITGILEAASICAKIFSDNSISRQGVLVNELGSELSCRVKKGCWFCTAPTTVVPGNSPHPWFPRLDASSYYQK